MVKKILKINNTAGFTSIIGGPLYFSVIGACFEAKPMFLPLFCLFFKAVSLGLSKNSLCVSELLQCPHFFTLMQLMVPGSVKRIKNDARLGIALSRAACRPSSHISARATSELKQGSPFPRNHPKCQGKSPSRAPPSLREKKPSCCCYHALIYGWREHPTPNKIFNSLDFTWLARGCNEAFDLIKYPTSSVGLQV